MSFGIIPVSKSIEHLSVKKIVESQDAPDVIDLLDNKSDHQLHKIGGKHLRFKVGEVTTTGTSYVLPDATPGLKTTVFLYTVSDDSATLDATTSLQLKTKGTDKFYGVKTVADMTTSYVEASTKLTVVGGTAQDAKASFATLECITTGIWHVKSFGLFDVVA